MRIFFVFIFVLQLFALSYGDYFNKLNLIILKAYDVNISIGNFLSLLAMITPGAFEFVGSDNLILKIFPLFNYITIILTFLLNFFIIKYSTKKVRMAFFFSYLLLCILLFIFVFNEENLIFFVFGYWFEASSGVKNKLLFEFYSIQAVFYVIWVSYVLKNKCFIKSSNTKS